MRLHFLIFVYGIHAFLHSGSLSGAESGVVDPRSQSKLRSMESLTTEDADTISKSASNAAGSISNDTYTINVGDKLSLQIEEDHQPPKVLPVSLSGEVEVPEVGRVAVAGRNVTQAAKEIKMRLEKSAYFKATVLLSVEESALKSIDKPESQKSRQIYVVGSVRGQGAQEIPPGGHLSVSHAILKAGGFSSFANGKRVQIVRKSVGGQVDRIEVDVLSIHRRGKIENDVELIPEDLVIVPEKIINF